MRRFSIGVAAALSLAACATQAQMQATAIRENTTFATDQFIGCVRFVYDAPEFLPVKASMPFNFLEATLAQQSDTSRATDAQINAILVAHPKYQQCRSLLLERVSRTTPTISPILIAGWTESDANLVLLIQKKLAWGEYVQRGRAIAVKGHGLITAEAQRIDAGLQQSHADELQRRQAAASAFAAYAQQQQLINAMNRPVQVNVTTQPTSTNCRKFGNNVTCTTQ